MTQEDKELLLKDLSARLPYGVILTNGAKVRSIDVLTKIVSGIGTDKNIEDTKYYLRPMSSMTEEERKYIVDKCAFTTMGPIGGNFGLVMPVIAAEWLTDFYNSHYLDYRGLIEKGLAIEVTEQNNPYGNS